MYVLCGNFHSSLLPPKISCFPLSQPRMHLLCMPVRLYFEAKPVHPVICCCAFVYLFIFAGFLPSPFPNSVWIESLLFGQLGPGSSTVQLYWLILIKQSPETGEGSSEYGQGFNTGSRFTTADIGISRPNVKQWENMRRGKTTEA